jgi:hypothetical protein
MAKTESYYFYIAGNLSFALSLAPGFIPVLSRDGDNQAVSTAFHH